MSERSSMRGSWTLGCLIALGVGVNAAAAPQCTARSGASVNPLVELYTSEGCSSCLTAEAWMTSLKNDARLWRDFVPVAFHVHSPDSHDWGRPPGDTAANDRTKFEGSPGVEAYLDQLARHYRIVCITDHLKSGYACSLAQAAKSRDDITVFPGVEASVVTNMGRFAAHTAQEVTFEQMLNHDHEYCPRHSHRVRS